MEEANEQSQTTTFSNNAQSRNQRSMSATPRFASEEEEAQYIYTYGTCKICTNRYDKAHHWQVALTKCYHTLCIECVLKLMKDNQSCPFCRAEILANSILFLRD